MASRSYVPRHSLVAEPSTFGMRRTATVLATSVGVAAAATTAFAGSAEASAHNTAWDRVASCESGGNWHIDTGNGYYGGLQFSSSTWNGYGGHTYAGQADRASRAEQIEVARRVLAAQGPNAWPVCGPRGGLTMSSGQATASRLPTIAGGTRSAGGHAHSSASRVLHSQQSRQRHRSHQRHQGHGTVHKRRTHHRATYHVHSGDTLSAIAARFHVHGGWHALYRANRHHIHNPNNLRVGQRLILP